MLVTGDQLICHLIGDYALQSDWQANEKTKKFWIALVHAYFYTIPFFVMMLLDGTWSMHKLYPLLVIIITHAIIDHWRLARYVCWGKNFIQPMFAWTRPACSCGDKQGCSDCGKSVTTLVRNYPWSECSGTGYHKDKPMWLACWLMFIADNTIHILINAVALKFL